MIYKLNRVVPVNYLCKYFRRWKRFCGILTEQRIYDVEAKHISIMEFSKTNLHSHKHIYKDDNKYLRESQIKRNLHFSHSKLRNSYHSNSIFFNTCIDLLKFNNITFLTILRYSTHTDSSNNQNQESCTTEKDHNNFNSDIECAINQQITAELEASHTYLSLASYFDNINVALPGCYGFYKKMHEEEHEHAHKFIDYLNMRGGKVQLTSIAAPKDVDWKSIGNALQVSIHLEKDVKDKLITLHEIAEKHHDYATMDFVVFFINDQDKSICEFVRLITRYNEMSECKGCGCSDFLFDKELYESFVRKTNGDKKYI